MAKQSPAGKKNSRTSPLLIAFIFLVVGACFAHVEGYDLRKLLPAETVGGGNAAGSGGDRCATLDVLDGYKLPATIGKTGNEDPVDSTGTMSHGETLAFKHLAKTSQAHRDYYITMRWNYAAWDWNGVSYVVDEKQMNWMKATPRLVVVKNKTNGRRIIAAALESGPAPWTGVDMRVNNNPKQGWNNPQTDFTPGGYTGRVSGFPPPAIQALAAEQGMYTGKGDVLEYAWAANQKETPGPCP